MPEFDLSFVEYFEKFSGGEGKALSKEDFEKYIKDAKLFLENMISGPLDKEYQERAKECLARLLEEVASEQKCGSIRREDIDGYSVTFLEKSPVAKRLSKIVSLYFGKSGLVFAGVE